MIASRCRSDLTPDCTTSPPFGVNGSQKNGFVVTVSTRASAGAFISVGCHLSTTARRTLGSRQLRLWLVPRPPGLTVRRPRVLLVQPRLLRSFAFCLCGSLHLCDPGSFSLCLLGRFALDLAGGFTLRLLRRLALCAFGSLDLRF